MDLTSVAPVQGAVLCFRGCRFGLTDIAHGDTRGSLLHEGSAVGPGGGKFVIRTELLFEAKGYGQFAPPASAGVLQGGKGMEGAGG